MGFHLQQAWPLALGAFCLFVSLRALRNNYIRWGPAWNPRHYGRARYPLMFWSYVVLMGVAGLYGIGSGLSEALRAHQLAGLAIFALGLALVVPLAKALDEHRKSTPG